MRKLANDVDCAPMTLYSYFRDKHALLTELAHEGFEKLADDLGGVEPGDPLKALRRGCLHYVDFGLRNPEQYRIIFMSPQRVAGKPTIEPPALLRENRAFSTNVRRVQKCVDRKIMRGDAFAGATILWTVLHGIVALLIDIPTFPFGDARKYAERTIDVALAGLRSMQIAPLETT